MRRSPSPALPEGEGVSSFGGLRGLFRDVAFRVSFFMVLLKKDVFLRGNF